MKALQILMPMGGLGQRFRDQGYDTPKPLINVDGVAMFQKALAAYDNYEGEKRHLFVIRKDTDEEYGLADQIKTILPDAKINILDHNTGGAVETCLIAEDLIDPELPLVIMDCDITFNAPHYFEKMKEAVDEDKFDGLLLSFTSSDPRYSFAEVNESEMVIRTAEKVAISDNALMGAYFFTKASIFLDAAHELVNRQLDETMKEYFVSLIYNILIESNRRVGLAKGSFTSFGTPEELQAYFDRNGS